MLAVRILLGVLLGLTLGALGAGTVGAVPVLRRGVPNQPIGPADGGAAVEAAAGVLIAWLRLDYNPLLRLSITAGVLLLAGVGGAWGRFERGAGSALLHGARYYPPSPMSHWGPPLPV